MPFPALTIRRERIPALAVTAALHALLIVALLNAIVTPPPRIAPVEHETQITLLPLIAPPLPSQKRQRRKPSGGSNAITTYFNPYAVPMFAPQPRLQGLQTALAACAPENYDMASDEVRKICGRIGALLKHDPGHFGVMQDVADPKYWERELARRNAPYLAPCMSPGGPNLLYTLTCVYDVLFNGYDSEKMQRYSK